ncbi:MAG: amidohydrolase family protein [Chloroflexi bacterium]|nr:amidohydrolase family protein [Chloroflexota bacterium]
MIIDTHIHPYCGTPDRKYFPWRQSWHICMRWAYGGGLTPPFQRDARSLVPRQEQRMSDPDGAYTIAAMDHQGIDTIVALPVDYDINWGQESQFTVDEKHAYLQMLQTKYPGRVLGFSGPDVRRPNSFQLFKRGIEEYGLKGFKMVPGCGYYPWDERLFPMYEYCLDNDLPVFTCTQWGSGGGYRYARFSDPMHVNDMLCEFPDLKVVLLHAGHSKLDWFENSIRTIAGSRGGYIEPDAWLFGYGLESQKSLMPSNAFNDEASIVTMLAKAKSVAGTFRILFGTDSGTGPAYQGDRSGAHFGWRTWVNWWRKLPETAAKYGHSFTQQDVEWILGENAARLFKIKPAPEWEWPYKFGWRYRNPDYNRGGNQEWSPFGPDVEAKRS